METTLKDIAEHLGISVSTVSRGLNNKGRISDEMRRKILETAELLHYQPNEVARELRMQRSMTIGVIVPDVSNEFYSRLLKLLDLELWKLGYSIIICDSDEQVAREQHYFQLLQTKKVSGMIISPVSNSTIYNQSDLTGRCVFLDNEPGGVGDHVTFIGIDNRRAAHELTNQLLHAGHRRIGIIVGDLMETTSSERLQGFQDALGAAGVPVQNDWICSGDCRFESGYKMLRRLAQSNHCPSAILAHNNLEALGILAAARDLGMQVPDDLSLVCFDNYTNPSLVGTDLTCVRQPLDLLAKTAVDCITNDDARQDPPARIHLPYTLHRGNSIYLAAMTSSRTIHP